MSTTTQSRPASRPHISTCRLIDLPGASDQRGHLAFIEGGRHIPFNFSRVFFLYGMPAGCSRGGHAHKRLEQFLIPLSGYFEMLLDDGHEQQRVVLDRPNQGLYLPRMIWSDLDHFSAGTVCAVLASMPYEETDYIRNYDDYKRAIAPGRPSIDATPA